MCGRFTSTTSAADLAAYFDAEGDGVVELGADFNVAPTREVYIVRERERRRSLDLARWGLVPAWAADPSVGSRLINARCETASTKPSFRSSFARRRCIVPADGFYEWVTVPDRRKKQPFHIRARDRRPLAFAGLWDSWRPTDRPDVPPLVTCTILTGEANATVAPHHHRMPIILEREEWSTWLDPTLDDVPLLESLLDPAPDALLEAYPVSVAVNDGRRHDPALIDEVDIDPDGGTDGQGRLL